MADDPVSRDVRLGPRAFSVRAVDSLEESFVCYPYHS